MRLHKEHKTRGTEKLWSSEMEGRKTRRVQSLGQCKGKEKVKCFTSFAESYKENPWLHPYIGRLSLCYFFVLMHYHCAVIMIHHRVFLCENGNPIAKNYYSAISHYMWIQSRYDGAVNVLGGIKGRKAAVGNFRSSSDQCCILYTHSDILNEGRINTQLRDQELWWMGPILYLHR